MSHVWHSSPCTVLIDLFTDTAFVDCRRIRITPRAISVSQSESADKSMEFTCSIKHVCHSFLFLTPTTSDNFRQLPTTTTENHTKAAHSSQNFRQPHMVGIFSPTLPKPYLLAQPTTPYPLTHETDLYRAAFIRY